MSAPEGRPPGSAPGENPSTAPGPADTRPPSPTVDAPTQEIGPVGAESVLPGGHRGGFQRLPTGPVGITSQSAPADPDGEHPAPLVQWAMPEPEQPRRGLAGWALVFAILGLVLSLFVGWGFPLGMAGIVAGILALRRPLESRGVAIWAIVLAGVSILYSVGWLLFAAVASGFVG
ncbi:hypothetical protein [Microbacterium sp. 4R-513]|uniref:DUF4190 domain-containing protein n=1 Tax=Microbacterium sp. 4R-513 TaxID=2567934 RepID=UPI0019D0A69E|nr:hypothetical protein [Microbacterium sp. 4R-513]